MNNKMKLFGIGLVVVMAIAALGVGIAFAQTLTHNNVYGLGWMMNGNTQKVNGYSMMGGNGQTGNGTGMMGGNAQNASSWEWMDAMHDWMTTSGGMHTFVWNALAVKLGLTSDQLYAEVNSGKTIVQIAEEKGVSRAGLVATLETAHQESLAQAVTDGVLTQDQVDSILAQIAWRYEWMLDNMGSGSMMGSQYGPGGMMNGQTGTGGMMNGQYGAGGHHGNWNINNTNQQPKPETIFLSREAVGKCPPLCVFPSGDFINVKR
jgi:hypothetical protein